jgi:hypothetical protein
LDELEALKFMLEQFSHLPKHKNDPKSKKLSAAMRVLRKTVKKCEEGEPVVEALETLKLAGYPVVPTWQLVPIVDLLLAMTYHPPGSDVKQINKKDVRNQAIKLSALIENAQYVKAAAKAA